MRRQTRMIVMALVTAISVATASALYAQQDRGSSGSDGMMGRDGMMGGGGRGMMGSMTQMMETCGQMMQGMKDGSGRPNDQWKKASPAPGEKS
ncbi:MAG: hypothetical protein WD871_03235 [Xanthobacteraceae bacterium]